MWFSLSRSLAGLGWRGYHVNGRLLCTFQCSLVINFIILIGCQHCGRGLERKYAKKPRVTYENADIA